MRPRATIGATRCDGQASRVSFCLADGGDCELVVIHCATAAEAVQLSAFIATSMPDLAPPRTLTRRRQLLTLAVAAAKLIDTPLSTTEVAHLHAWARAAPME